MAKKTTFVLPPKIEKLLAKMATEEGISKSEVMRRAIALYDILCEEKKKNKKVFIGNPQSEKIEKEIVFGWLPNMLID